jgi:hypothetical protein
MSKFKMRYRVTLEFDTTLTRNKFDDLLLQMVHHLEQDFDRDHAKQLGNCVYIATDIPTTTLLRNMVADDIEVGIG